MRGRPRVGGAAPGGPAHCERGSEEQAAASRDRLALLNSQREGGGAHGGRFGFRAHGRQDHQRPQAAL